MGVVDGQKTQLETEKHGGRIVIFVMVLVRSVKYGRSENGVA